MIRIFPYIVACSAFIQPTSAQLSSNVNSFEAKCVAKNTKGFRAGTDISKQKMLEDEWSDKEDFYDSIFEIFKIDRNSDVVRLIKSNKVAKIVNKNKEYLAS